MTSLVLAALAGCASNKPQPVTVPDVVTVPVTQYVPVPDALTKPCPIAEPKSMTVAEAVRVARERKASLQACNAQLRAIKTLGKSGGSD